MKRLLLMLAVIATSFSSFSQSAEKKWGIGLSYGTSQYSGDVKNDFFNFNAINFRNNGVASLYLSRYLTQSFDLTFMGNYGSVGLYDKATENFLFKSKDFYNLNVQARYKLANDYIIEQSSVIKPYALVGLGMDNHMGQFTNEGKNTTLNLGLGLNVMLTDDIALFYQLTYGYMLDDSRDLKDVGTGNDSWMIHSVGLNINIGSGPDADKDGVTDKKDKCPSTPANVAVDKMGCPLDGDADGVADYLDKCVSIAGTLATNGCPDADKDGIADADDQCPSEAGKADLKGCPDNDGDGIINSKDKCPDVKGISAFDGCPDTDADGIQDSEDKCPTVAGVKTFNGCPDTDGDGIEDAKDMCINKKGTEANSGCPDTDGDGIHDGVDKCPSIAGTTANNGCPEVKAAVKQLFQKALQGIQFETGKSTIKKQSNNILDQVVKVMKENPTYNLIIEGHTDDVGNDDANMTLSQARAEAVAKYLTDKGINASRLSAKGFGETMPVESNTTKAGRDKNRRVELKVEFED